MACRRSILVSFAKIVGICAALQACADKSSDDDDGGGDDSGAGSQESGGSDVTSDTTSGASSVGTTAMSGSAGSGSSASTATGETGGETVGDLCMPDPSDDACSACTKENCCDPLAACLDDAICVCMTECANGLDDIATCTQMCGTTDAFSPLTQCVTVNCAADCI